MLTCALLISGLLGSVAGADVEIRLIQVGENDWGPEFAIEVHNESKVPVTIVKPGDGSALGWRTPIVRWMVTPAGKPDEPPRPQDQGSTCGNINALKRDEVVELAAGSRITIKELWTHPRFSRAGRYRVSVSFVNDPALEWKGIPLGTHDPSTMARVKESTPLSLQSQQLVVDVKKPNVQVIPVSPGGDLIRRDPDYAPLPPPPSERK